jgi:DNA-binding transcriptional ArsR family regulator
MGGLGRRHYGTNGPPVAERLSGHGVHVGVSTSSIPAAAGKGRDRIDRQLSAIEALPSPVFANEAARSLRGGAGIGEVRDLEERAALRKRIQAHARPRGQSVARFVETLLSSPTAARRRLVGFLVRSWDGFFRETWEEIRDDLSADLAERRDLLAARGPLQLLKSLHPSVTVSRRGGVAMIEKAHRGEIDVTRSRLHLVPSTFGSPHLVIQDEAGWPPCIQYSLEQRSERSSRSPSAAEQRVRALSDPTRVLICRLIAREARPTAELADLMHTTPPRVAHHLRILREAGLVRTRRESRFVLYSLDARALAPLGTDLLDSFLR